MEKKFWMGIFIIFVMVFSIFGFVLSYTSPPATQTVKYGDFKFKNVNNQYFTKIDGVERGFLFFPGDLEYVELNEDAKVLLEKPVITVTYDPESSLVENFADAQYYFEVQLPDKAVVRALTDPGESKLEKASCDDATEAQPVIMFKEGSSSGISVEDNCIILTCSDAYGVYHQTERIIYFMLGVME